MKKVLVIAYYFPPLGMSGVHRVVNFCRYLPEFGWDPIVLTVKPIRYFAYDMELMREVECKVLRTESLDPLRVMKILGLGKKFGELRMRTQGVANFLFLPDNKIGWLPFAVIEGLRVIKDVDMIFATAPPYTGLLVGWMLKKLSHLPLVIEFRDRWPYLAYSTRVHGWLSDALKKMVVRDADAIIAINEHSNPGGKDTVIIPTGFRPEDFISNQRGRESNKFTIVHTGSFIPPRSPKYFLTALNELIDEGKIKADEVRVELIGFNVGADFICDPLIREMELQGVIKLYGYRSHRYCMESLANADALWIIIDEDERSDIGVKIGEYLGANKPILATIPEGSGAKLLRLAKSVAVVPPRDVPAIKSAIYDFYLKFKDGSLDVTRSPMLNEYSWVNLTSRLAKIFEVVSF